MLREQISLTETVVYSVFGAVSFTIAQYAAALAEWARMLCVLLTIIFVSFVIVQLAYYSAYHVTRVYDNYKKAQATTPELLFVQNVRFLTPQQIALVQQTQQNMKMRMLPSDNGPIPFFVCADNVEVPQDFVKDFLDACDDKTLVPVREYSDSQARVFASALTSTLVGFGFAARGAGNQRSTWTKSIEEARKFFGV